jgi:hypothetical protein
MMKDYCAVAVQWRNGIFELVSELKEVEKLVDLPALMAEYPLNVISSSGAGYTDRGTVLPAARFRQLSRSSVATDWVDALDRDVTFILVHESEWETGLGG